MVELPDFLAFFQQRAQEAWQQGAICDFEFSGSTYQVQVLDPYTKKKEWAFLQLNDGGQIKDCFCSCMSEDESPGCIHLAVAFLGIYGKHQNPLHQRFEHSLWNQLCQASAKKWGYAADILTKVDDNHYEIRKERTVWLTIELLTEEAASRIHQMLETPINETEETSLKFSNLTQEELSQWRSGQPSLGLSYVLSFWSDLAKWLMEMQEMGKAYHIEYTTPVNHLPEAISVAFGSLKFSFRLDEELLSAIILSLNSVDSALKVYMVPQSAIKEISFDDQIGQMHIKMFQKQETVQEKGIDFNEWIYVPLKGFYAKRPVHLFPSEILEGDQIPQALNAHYSLIQAHLKENLLHPTPKPFSYHFQFQPNWDLHIEAYLFNPGDLSKPGSWFFGDWVYIKTKGFYKIEGRFFKKIKTVIAAKEMNEFISQQRVWLNLQPSLEVHLAGKEPRLSYGLDENNRLIFFKAPMEEKQISRDHDYGAWVYLEGEGFYPKAAMNSLMSIRAGLSISEDQLPLFIRMNREELQMIPRFFSEICPILESGLSIYVNESQQVVVEPKYRFAEGYGLHNVQIFEGFSFVAEEGFYELTGNQSLPDKYRQTQWIDNKHLQDFFAQEWEIVKKYAWEKDPRLELPHFQRLAILHLAKKEILGKEWYILKLAYKTNQGLADAISFWSALKSSQRFLFNEAGRFDLLHKRYEFLRGIDKKRIDLRSHTFSMTALELIRLQILEDVDLSHLDKDSLALLKNLLNFAPSAFPNLPKLKSQLRPYQQVGVQWLWFLLQHHLSGFVCDDMGLGKTHQAMALMALYHQEIADKTNKKQHFLVICPTSVLYHWQEKMELFLPDLKVFTFYGTNRRLKDFDDNYDVMLTSYGIWRNEQKLLQKIPFNIAFFDEIQVAKNHTSQIYASLINVQADMRVGLTGTPIENHLRELKALFDIVVPTYMPNDALYRDFFVKPIENQANVERRNLLSRFVKPFIIRRKKEDVLLDLPDKIEEISHCTLLEDQKRLYNNVLENSRERILQVLHDRTVAVPYMHIFALLSSLKQICNHPAAFLKMADQFRDYTSGKWELFKELLDEARESSQKVVVFSQYLGMLDIIELHLKEQGIAYATIRGSTVNRSEPIKRFNQDPKCEVFVGSLRATGLGIDLTAASVVIHYDRWWNAARENQATDRVHRIGQTRGVQVFKLVTLGTIEERIDQLIIRKGQLLEDVIGIDENQFIKQFKREELIQLLQFIDIS